MNKSESSGGAAQEGSLQASRRDKLHAIRELGHDPWGGRFDDHSPIDQIRARDGEIRFVGEQSPPIALPGPDRLGDFRAWLSEQGAGDLAGPNVRAAGRIVLKRDTGKLIFADLRDRTGRIQLLIGKRQVGDDWAVAECLDLGDLVGVDGELKRTRTGELTIFVDRLHFLTKAIDPPPEKHHGLADPELRRRMRYLDLAYGDGVLERFVRRAKIVQSIRGTLLSQGYLEIEGPTLHGLAGGAAARPFTTHHNALDIDLVLRIALELHLKRLLVGGMERVFELGRVYRNEGISPRHNPEFTMLEVYQAYGNYETMMELTEQCVVEAVAASGQEPKLPYGDVTIDFTPPFRRATYHELFREHAGVDPKDADRVRSLALGMGVDVEDRHPDVVMNDVFEEAVEKRLAGPIFVLDYPASLCPLTKRRRDDPSIAERFELFVQGMEIANAYTELNDPDLQEELFRTQLAGLSEEDSMARMDHDFIRALRQGMPPAGGLGIGIDRLIMLLTDSPSIRDVILFPLLRPEA